MNPKYIYVSGETFYLINELPGDDPIGASYEAMHRDAFGHAELHLLHQPAGGYSVCLRWPGAALAERPVALDSAP